MWETDEVIYTSIAREMLETGDWITLHYKGQAWFTHPPLYMWLTALTGMVFGFSNFIARLWCAIFGVVGVIAIYYLGRLFYNERVGFFAGLILATSFQYILQSRIAIFDVPYVVLILLALLFFFKGYKEQKSWAYWFFYIFMGLGTLMKGPISILLPVLVLIVYLIVQKEFFKVFKEAHPILGVLLTFAIGGSWYLAEYIIHGQVFYDRVVGYYLINRFTGIVETHTGPFYYYLPVLFLGFLPWTAFLYEGFILFINERKVKENLFVILYIILVLIFFSAAKTKLPGYVMSIYPFLALIVARLLDSRQKLNISFYVLIVFSLFLIMLTFPLSNAVLLKENLKLGLALIPLVVLMGVGGILSALVYFITKRSDHALYTLVLSMLLFLIVLASSTTPIIEEFKPRWM